MKLDQVDRKILRLLQEDARISYRKIGERTGLRAPSVHARVKRMEDAGVIRGYRADVAPAEVGRGMTAFISIGVYYSAIPPAERATPRDTGGGIMSRAETIAEALRKDPDVVEVHAVVGEDDLLVKVRVADMAGLEKFLLRTVEPLQGVRRTNTTIAVRSVFERAPAV